MFYERFEYLMLYGEIPRIWKDEAAQFWNGSVVETQCMSQEWWGSVWKGNINSGRRGKRDSIVGNSKCWTGLSALKAFKQLQIFL